MLPWIANRDQGTLKVFVFKRKRRETDARVELNVFRVKDAFNAERMTTVCQAFVNSKLVAEWLPCKALIDRMPRTFYIALQRIKQHFLVSPFDPYNPIENTTQTKGD